MGELLHEVKKKEREATGTVRSLETDLQKEYTEHEKESKQGTDEIKKLKEELQELKTRSAIETSFLEKKLRAKENATLRIFAQKEKALEEEQKSEQEEQQKLAIFQLQEEGRLYLNRVRARLAAKKQKKGKKGKKKK